MLSQRETESALNLIGTAKVAERLKLERSHPRNMNFCFKGIADNDGLFERFCAGRNV